MHTDDDGPDRSPVDPSRDARWDDLIARLQARLPELVRDFTTAVADIPGYSPGPVDAEDLAETARGSLSRVIACIASGSSTSDLHEYAAELGRRRAEQGVPVSSLMSAVRLNFPVIWPALLTIADDQQRLDLANRAEEVWRVLDDYAVACYASHAAAREATARQEAGIRQEFVASLFTAQGQLPETRERFARAFGVSADGPYAVFAVEGAPAEPLRAAALGPRCFLHEAAERLYAFWPADHGADDYAIPEHIAGRRGGIALSPTGLSGLATAAQLATALAGVSEDTDAGPLRIERHWPRLARSRLRAVGADMGAALDDALEAARPGEAERLRTTVLTYLETGSIARTAELVYAHRNTVIKRLGRFHDVTRIDLGIPAQAAQVALAWL